MLLSILLLLASEHVVWATITEAQLREIVQQVSKELPVARNASTRNMHSVISHYSRVTDESRSMSLLNEVMERVLASEATSLASSSSSLEDLHFKLTSSEPNNLLSLSSRSELVLSRCSLKWDEDCSWFEYLPFRTMTGVCNNLGRDVCSQWPDRSVRKMWGASHTPLKRYVSPYPEEELSSLQKHYFELNRNVEVELDRDSNEQLPSPRHVSVALHQVDSSEDEQLPESSKFSHMLMQFGQFVDHDVTLVPEEEHPRCCEEKDERKCMNIDVSDDAFYTSKGVHCLPMHPSVIFCEKLSKYKEPMNALTAFVDASNVYGSDVEAANNLRAFDKGLLLVSEQKQHTFPPILHQRFQCGDGRCDEQPGLLSIHAIFVREHNRVARLLPQYSSHKETNDNIVYHMARRIVGAEMQSIVYNEWLPVVLGDEYAKYDLESTTWSSYNPCVNPSIANSFATAAFRFGHTLVQSRFEKCDLSSNRKEQKCDAFDLRSNFEKVDEAIGPKGKGVEDILLGQTMQPSQESDRLIVPDLTNFLFSNQHDFLFGEDLATRNIMRGRDHNLPPWSRFRKACGLHAPQSWQDRPKDITPENWNILQSLYGRPWNIELFPGSLAESKVTNGAVGKTFACILGEQFKELKFGDRFFFTHKQGRARFSRSQQRVLKNRRLRDILCDNTEMRQVVKNVFRLEDEKNNPTLDCQHTNDLRVDLLANIDRVSLPAINILIQSPHGKRL